MFNSTFINISIILWRSVLLVEETTDFSQVTDKLYRINVVLSTPCLIGTHNIIGTGTDYVGSYKTNNHYDHDGASSKFKGID